MFSITKKYLFVELFYQLKYFEDASHNSSSSSNNNKTFILVLVIIKNSENSH